MSLAANFMCDSEGGAGLEMLTREEAKAGRGEVTSAPCQAPNWLHTDPHVAAVAWSLSVSLSSDVTGGSGRAPTCCTPTLPVSQLLGILSLDSCGPLFLPLKDGAGTQSQSCNSPVLWVNRVCKGGASISR